MKTQVSFILFAAAIFSSPPAVSQQCSIDGNQCGGEEALGCSTQHAMRPLAAISNELGQTLTRYSEKFEPACIRHDFCYRHGWRTYGYDQVHCDNEFESNMYGICKEITGTDILQFAAEVGECFAAARVFAETVRTVGEHVFQKSEGSCCFYDEPQSGALLDLRQ